MIEDYEKATKTELSNEMIDNYRASKVKEIEDEKVKAFMDAREQAKANWKAEQDVKKAALLKVWQGYEDNDYTVPVEEMTKLVK